MLAGWEVKPVRLRPGRVQLVQLMGELCGQETFLVGQSEKQVWQEQRNSWLKFQVLYSISGLTTQISAFG